jgi:hypothetical protein
MELCCDYKCWLPEIVSYFVIVLGSGLGLRNTVSIMNGELHRRNLSIPIGVSTQNIGNDPSLKHCPLRLASVEARPYFSACSTSSSAPERVPVLVCSSGDLYPAEPLRPPHGRYAHGSIHHHDTCYGSRILARRTGRK